MDAAKGGGGAHAGREAAGMTDLDVAAEHWGRARVAFETRPGDDGAYVRMLEGENRYLKLLLKNRKEMTMPRPKGSKNKPKEDKAQPRPSAGHNSEMTEEQREALFFDAKGRYATALAKKKAEDAAFKNVCRTIKADGVALKDIKFALDLDADENGAMLERRRREAMIARWMGHPIGTQADLFGDGVDRTPAVDKAFAEGKRAGMEGASMKSPEAYHPSSEQFQAWCRGWHTGQEAIFNIKELKDGPNLIKAAPKQAEPEGEQEDDEGRDDVPVPGFLGGDEAGEAAAA
jgi:hypothetical protein